MNHHGYTESTEESTEFDASILISPYRSASAVNFLFINSATGWLGTICDFGFREFREGQADCPQIVDLSITGTDPHGIHALNQQSVPSHPAA